MIKKSKKVILSLLMTLSLVTVTPATTVWASYLEDSLTKEENKAYLDFIKNECTPTDNQYIFYNKKDGKHYGTVMTNKFGLSKSKNWGTKGGFYCKEDGSVAYNEWVYVRLPGKNEYRWQYRDSDGQAVHGYQTINGLKYYFSQKNGDNINGYLKTNWWRDDDDQWRYSYPDGSIKEGWLNYNGDWYYIYSDGLMAKDTTTPDGYRVNSKGICIS